MKMNNGGIVLAWLYAALLLTGCGGGGGGGGGGSVAKNTSTPPSTIMMGGSSQGAPLNLSGIVSTIAGSPITVLGSALWTDGAGAVATFSSPYDITTDGINLYVADDANGNIRQIVIATGTVTTLAGPDSAICAANVTTIGGVTAARCPKGQLDGTSTSARFLSPSSITTDGASLYVGDQQIIRKIVIATGVVTTIAGAANGYLDAVGTAAKFSAITSITTDGTNVYVADFANIRKLVLGTGVVSTLAGPGAVFTSGNIDGTGSAARFGTTLHGMTTDGTNLYLADYRNSSIRKIGITTGVVTTLATGLSTIQGLASDGTNLYTGGGFLTTYKVNIATGAASTLNGYAGVNGMTTDGISLFAASAGANSVGKIQ